MNTQQVLESIERSGCHILMIKDFGNNRLLEINCSSATQAAKELEEMLPNYSGYKKLLILGKKGTEDTAWSKGYTWQLEFSNVAADGKQVAGIPMNTGIGATEYIGMFERLMGQNFELQKTIIEQQTKLNNQDPTKWLPVIRELAPALGFKTVAGTQTEAKNSDLHFEDAGEQLNDEQISDATNSGLISLSKKISGNQMLKIVQALNANSKISEQADDIAKVLKALAEKPDLLPMALRFI
jgi:hypothetical protein